MRLSLHLAGTDFSVKSRDVRITTNEHGFQSLECFVPMTLTESFRFYDMAPTRWLTLNYGGGVVWEGRVEDRAVVTGGLQIVALGAWSAMYDAPYTAVWSDTSTALWEVGTADLISSNRKPQKYVMDNNNRLYIGMRKNEMYNSSADIGNWVYLSPDENQQEIRGISFDYKLDVPSGWRMRIISYSSGFSTSTTEKDVTSAGSAISGALHLTIGINRQIIAIGLYNASGSSYTHTGETGAYYLKITNIRIVAVTTNRVNTTVAVAISSGTQTVTPGSMTGIYVGQSLVIDDGTNSESVTVTAVTVTTFTAVFANSYAAGATVKGFVIYADEIVSDLVSHINGLSGEIDISTALIESPGLDLTDEVYEDAWPGDIAVKLARLGDDQTPPRRWEVGVWEDRRLHFRPRGSAGRTWAVDAVEFGINSTLATLRNSMYAVYKDANGRVLRTATTDDTASQSRYDLIRRGNVGAQTTSETQAEIHRDAALEDGKNILPRSQVRFERLTDGSGGQYPKWMARSGDTLTVRNLPPTLSTDIDKIRTFVLSETAYFADDDEVTVTPEEPLPTLEVLVGRREEGF